MPIMFGNHSVAVVSDGLCSVEKFEPVKALLDECGATEGTQVTHSVRQKYLLTGCLTDCPGYHNLFDNSCVLEKAHFFMLYNLPAKD